MQRIRIHFEDHGQDFLWWELETQDKLMYEVVGCGPFQGWVWVGHLVPISTVKEGTQPMVINKKALDYGSLEDGVRTMNYAIWRVEYLHHISSDPGDEQPDHHITSIAV